jgi:hypothetical protein
VTPEDEPRHGRKRLETETKRATRVSGPASLDDSGHAGESIEPNRKLRRLEAYDDLGSLLDPLVREEQHSLGG